MVIAHIAAFHKATDARIYHKECLSLAGAGHDVRLLVAEPPDDAVTQVGPGRIEFERLGVRPSRNHAVWLARALWAVWRQARTTRAPVYHFHEGDMIPALLLVKLARGSDVKVIYDAHEDLPRQVRSRCVSVGLRWLAPVVGSVYGFTDWLAKRCFDGFVCATPTIAEKFPPGRTVTVCNYPKLDEFPPPDAQTPYAERPRDVVYAGGISKIRGVFEMVRAMELLPGELSQTRLNLAGEFGSPALREQAAALPAWPRVVEHGYLGRDEIAALYGRSRVGLVLLHPRVNYLDALPVKLFEYMAAGLPVVASDFPLWRRIVEEAGCGLLVDPLDPRAVADAMAWLLTHPQEAEAMGRRGREAVERQYNWGTQAEELLGLYRRLGAAVSEPR